MQVIKDYVDDRMIFFLQYLYMFRFLLIQVYSYFWICEHGRKKEWENRNMCAFNGNCYRPNEMCSLWIQSQRTEVFMFFQM